MWCIGNWFFLSFHALQSFHSHLGTHIAENHRHHFTIYRHYLSYRREPLYAHRVALQQRRVILCYALANSLEFDGCLLVLFSPFCLALGFSGLTLFHLAQLLGKVHITHHTLLLTAHYIILKAFQLFSYLARLFFVGLILSNFLYGILYALITLSQKFLCLLTGALKYLLTLAFNIGQLSFITRNGFLDVFLALMNVLAFVFPITLVSHNILQVFVTLNIIGTHYLRRITNHLVGNACLTSNLDSKRTARTAYLQLEKGLHLMAVVKHGTINHTLMVVGKMLQILIVSCNHSKSLSHPKLLKHGLGNGSAYLGLGTCTKLIN